MDCLVEKDGVKTELSSMNFLVTDFKDSSPSVKASRKEINSRSGFVFNGATHSQKNIGITGKFVADSAYEMEEMKDDLNALFSNDEPFYITKMLPVGDLYEFELPGQTEGFELLGMPTEPYKYRYKVLVENEIDYSFVGKSNAGFLTEFSISLKTAELPFGETLPKDEVITKSFINYRGTAKCSQLEWPWIVKLTSTETQPGKFVFTIGDRTFESFSPTPLASGDIFLIKGIETLKNGSNFNDSTNYEHFILNPSTSKRVPVSTNFKGKIELLNKVELYK